MQWWPHSVQNVIAPPPPHKYTYPWWWFGKFVAWAAQLVSPAGLVQPGCNILRTQHSMPGPQGPAGTACTHRGGCLTSGRWWEKPTAATCRPTVMCATRRPRSWGSSWLMPRGEGSGTPSWTGGTHGARPDNRWLQGGWEHWWGLVVSLLARMHQQQST